MSPKIRLSISVGLGLLTTGGLWLYLEKNRNELKAQVTMTHVVRAKRYIKTGKRLTKGQIEVVSIPEAFVEPTALRQKEEILDADQKPRYKSRSGFLEGQQITRSGLIDEKENLGLAWLLDEGQTSLTLRLKSEEALGGWVQPGDSVHLFSWIDKQTDWPEARAQLLIDNVQVLAIDQEIWDPSAPLAPKITPKSLVNDEFLVTMKLTTAQVARVLVASQKGTIWLSLVSPVETKGEKGVFASLQSLK